MFKPVHPCFLESHFQGTRQTNEYPLGTVSDPFKERLFFSTRLCLAQRSALSARDAQSGEFLGHIIVGEVAPRISHNA